MTRQARPFFRAALGTKGEAGLSFANPVGLFCLGNSRFDPCLVCGKSASAPPGVHAASHAGALPPLKLE